MNTDKKYLHKLMVEFEVGEVSKNIDFIDYSNASLSSTEFWDNELDDEVWKDF